MMIRHYKLSSALRYRSRTSQYPFIVAHECKESYTDKDGTLRERTREYYAFDDVEHYLKNRINYPHSHEVIYPRFGAYYTDISDEDKGSNRPQQGRLCFDFDIEQRYYKEASGKTSYVSPEFQERIVDNIKETFETYYKIQPDTSDGIDLERLSFVWLESSNNKKYSRHLIVNGAYFCNDWVVQSQTFYTLFLLTVHRNKSIGYIPIDKLVDKQVARSHATMRMLHNSKIGGNPLLSQSKVDFYDTLIQLYRAQDAKKEQNIPESSLRLDLLLDLKPKDAIERKLLYDIPQLRKSLEDEDRPRGAGIELTEEAQTLLSDVLDDFTVRPGGIEPGRIILDRKEPSPCVIDSDNIHHHDGAYVIVSEEGMARFYCFRGCTGVDGKRYKFLGKVENKILPSKPKHTTKSSSITITTKPQKRITHLNTLLDDRAFDKLYKDIIF